MKYNYKLYFKEGKTVRTKTLDEIFKLVYKGYKLNINTYELTRPTIAKIFQISATGTIRETNPINFIHEFYHKKIIKLSDLEMLITDLENGKVSFETVCASSK